MNNPNRNISSGDRGRSNPDHGISNMVIGNKEKFTLAVGKHAFVPCEEIPISYLFWLRDKAKLHAKDKSVIKAYIKKKYKKPRKSKKTKE